MKACHLLVLGGALLTTLPVASLESAHMRLPADFATSAQRLSVDGLGGSTRGEFRFGD